MTKRQRVRQNHHAKLVADAIEQEKQVKERAQRKEEIQRKAKQELLKKLGIEADDLEAGNTDQASSAPTAAARDASGDVEMRQARGVKRTITKDKDKARTRRALKMAKARGDIGMQEVRKVLLGTKGKKSKPKVTPLGQETRREKRLRAAREKRLRKMGWNQSESEEAEGEDDQ
mmetsp:Transcript_63304/g.150999  ORF Transcript_63304/g.150999 Transcript_63304/m.150999 type:complete len:174 (+) Transcript_63304:53-574(+)